MSDLPDLGPKHTLYQSDFPRQAPVNKTTFTLKHNHIVNHYESSSLLDEHYNTLPNNENTSTGFTNLNCFYIFLTRFKGHLWTIVTCILLLINISNFKNKF